MHIVRRCGASVVLATQEFAMICMSCVKLHPRQAGKTRLVSSRLACMMRVVEALGSGLYLRLIRPMREESQRLGTKVVARGWWSATSLPL